MNMKKLITKWHQKHIIIEKRGNSSENNSAISRNEGVEGLCEMERIKTNDPEIGISFKKNLKIIIYICYEIRLLKSSNFRLIRENTHISQQALREQLIDPYVNN
jgi:hypothetical protein